MLTSDSKKSKLKSAVAYDLGKVFFSLINALVATHTQYIPLKLKS